jgi:hypothetical protein
MIEKGGGPKQGSVGVLKRARSPGLNVNESISRRSRSVSKWPWEPPIHHEDGRPQELSGKARPTDNCSVSRSGNQNKEVTAGITWCITCVNLCACIILHSAVLCTAEPIYVCVSRRYRQLDSIGFWRWCITHRINGSRFRNVVYLPSNSSESGRWTKSENPLIRKSAMFRGRMSNPTLCTSVHCVHL